MGLVFKRLPRGSKRPKETPKRPQEAPKRLPRGPQEAPKRPQEAPERPKRRPQTAHKRLLNWLPKARVKLRRDPSEHRTSLKPTPQARWRSIT